jgi:hypothetical protein
VDGLDVPNVDAVARTRWRLERIGGCRVAPRTDRPPSLSFMDGWASAPAECNEQGAPFQVDGRRFQLVESSSMTLAECPHGPMGYLEAATSWGLADDDRLYLLDAHDHAIFVARPIGAPGCIVDVPPNGRKLVAHGTEGCDTSGTDNDLRD